MEIRDKMLSVLQPLGGKEEVEELRDTIESGWWAKGPKVAKFEKEFAEMVDAKTQCVKEVANIRINAAVVLRLMGTALLVCSLHTCTRYEIQLIHNT